MTIQKRSVLRRLTFAAALAYICWSVGLHLLERRPTFAAASGDAARCVF